MSPDTSPAAAPRRGPGRPPALSDEQVARIRELVAGGERQASVADHFEISVSLVSMIARGARYPGAPGPITATYKKETAP